MGKINGYFLRYGYSIVFENLADGAKAYSIFAVLEVLQKNMTHGSNDHVTILFWTAFGR